MNQNSTLLEFLKSTEAQKAKGATPSSAPQLRGPIKASQSFGGYEMFGGEGNQNVANLVSEPEPSTEQSPMPPPMLGGWEVQGRTQEMSKLGDEPISFKAPMTPSSSPNRSTQIENVEIPEIPKTPMSTEDKIALGEERLQGYRDSEELSPQAQAAIERPPIRMGQGSAPKVEQGLQPPMGVEATQERLQERFGAPTISDIQAAPEGLGMQTDPQGRMIDPNVDRSSYEMESANRETRQEQMLQNRTEERQGSRGSSKAVNNKTMSMADATKLTGGDRKAARALIKRQEFQMGEFEPKEEKTPQQKEGERTPSEIESDRLKLEAQRLENERKRQVIEAGSKPEATPREKKRAEWEQMQEDMEADGMSPEEIADRRKSFLYGDKFEPWKYEDNGGEEDSTGVNSDAGSTPAASTGELPEGMPAASKFKGKTLNTPNGKYKSDGINWTKV